MLSAVRMAGAYGVAFKAIGQPGIVCCRRVNCQSHPQTTTLGGLIGD